MKSSGTFFSIISVREWPVCRSHQGENKTSFYLVSLKNFVWEKFVRFGPFFILQESESKFAQNCLKSRQLWHLSTLSEELGGFPSVVQKLIVAAKSQVLHVPRDEFLLR